MQSIIIQVLSDTDRRIIRKWMLALWIFTAILLALSIMLALQYAPETQPVLITSAMVLILLGNVILLFRNNMVDKLSKSLCFDGGTCYTVTECGITRDWSPVTLYCKGETLTFESKPGKRSQNKRNFAFHVLDKRDWRAVQKLRTRRVQPESTPAIFTLSTALPKNHAL